MPPTAATLRVGRYFLALLAILVVLFGLVFLPGKRHTPKLGLDLEGGKQIVLQAKKPGGGTPTASSMTVARGILTERVNGKGVSAAEVQQEGSDRIVISVPGQNKKDLAGIEKSAQLNFRPVVFAPVPPTTPPTPTGSATSGTAPAGTAPTGTAPAGASGSPSATVPAATTSTSPAATTGAASSPGALVQPLLAPPSTTSASPVAKSTAASPTTTKVPATSGTPTSTPPTATPATATPATAAATPEVQDPFTKLTFALPTSDVQYNELTTTQQSQLAAALRQFKCGSKPPDIPTKPLAACDSLGQKYLLGPVIVAGNQIQTASVIAPSSQSSEYQVSLTLKNSGDKVWSKYTGEHHSDSGSSGIQSPSTCSAATVPCAEYVGFTLDGDVLEAPHNEATISGTPTTITGGFTRTTATDLANQLKYGALPLSLSVLNNQNVSATLGAGQLRAGLLAGGIGLLLVVVYSLLYYRALGLVTIASLLVSGVLTYGSLVVLGREMGFTLTLAGIAGFIVAVGITADSFVVLFERLKDEIHSGRSMRVAVPRAWTRARRTILSADTVSFLAAAVLYYFAAGDVRGFAFTLGLSTVLDLVVVFLFTHPLVSLLSRSRAFGSARFTGLNSVRTGSPVVPAARPSRGAHAQAGGTTRRRGGATALVERDADSPADLDSIGTETVETGPLDVGPLDGGTGLTGDVGISSGEADADIDAAPPVPHRSSTAIGASAAERAAARRGRQVRPPKPEPVAVIEPASSEPASAGSASDELTSAVPPADDASQRELPTDEPVVSKTSLRKQTHGDVEAGEGDDRHADSDEDETAPVASGKGLLGRLRSARGGPSAPRVLAPEAEVPTGGTATHGEATPDAVAAMPVPATSEATTAEGATRALASAATTPATAAPAPAPAPAAPAPPAPAPATRAVVAPAATSSQAAAPDPAPTAAVPTPSSSSASDETLSPAAQRAAARRARLRSRSDAETTAREDPS